MYEINLIGIDKKRGYPLHTHATYEIVHYFEGEGFMRSSCGDFPLEPGNILLIPPGVLHGTDSKNGFKALTLRGEFGNSFSFPEPIAVHDNETFDAEALARMILRNRLAGKDYLAALMEAYVHFILQNFRPEDAITGAVRRIADTLTERFFEFDLSPAALLNESGYAEDYIRAQFKRIIGKTPTEFLHALRIGHAKYLIEIYREAISLSEVSARCGFTDYVYFSKKFKEQVGLSPKAYKKHREFNRR